MTRAFEIEKNETLLTIAVYSKARLFVGDSPAFGTELTTTDVLNELCDKTTRILRLNTDTMEAPEDITEHLALKYLQRADCDGDEIGEDNLPAYVLQSNAWAVWQDDQQAMAPVDPDQVHQDRLDRQAFDETPVFATMYGTPLVRGASLGERP